ncbi:hypothetical protein [Janthinobacterium sp. B9-8]|uniref:hypothetical protein n=1 Tax=Janthinobacterium sp. B9-8 TaxID=1236179 RepID=UPI00061D0547|nr:hypothetical protein [Janthinobacterium sp. B9-8]AMC36440.1 hypothetical protein VN23_18530 [Janthinobacterium sp. B9-8]
MKYFILFWLLYCPFAQAQWGRLFFSPAERAAARGDLAQVQAGAAFADTLRFDGEIRSRGKKLRWLNGEISQASIPAGLKVGQTLSRQSGAIRDVYQSDR